MGKIPAPADGKGPMMKTGGNPTKPAEKVKQVARGEPTRGSGSDTQPYSSAHRGKR